MLRIFVMRDKKIKILESKKSDLKNKNYKDNHLDIIMTIITIQRSERSFLMKFLAI